MNLNKKKTTLLKQILGGQENVSGLEEAKSFTAPVAIAGKFVTIKLPKSVLKYLHAGGVTELNVVPVNNTLQITANFVLTGIPAIDLSQLENQFESQKV